MDQQALCLQCRSSCFSLHASRADIQLRNNLFDDGLGLYLDYDNIREGHIVDHATPEFQRSNDKWGQQQQTLFVQNLLKGYRTEIILFRFDSSEDAMIVDGLQRLTALRTFFDNKLKVFGLYLNEFEGVMLTLLRSRVLGARMVTFNSWEEVGRFYIDINEGITHSKDDIQNCKDWFKKEKGILL